MFLSLGLTESPEQSELEFLSFFLEILFVIAENVVKTTVRKGTCVRHCFPLTTRVFKKFVILKNYLILKYTKIPKY
jgi:hypothetical protein